MPIRTIYWIAGAFCFVLGVLGYILPVLPGTFPMICAAYCFGKADPRIEAWLLNSRIFGPTLRRWRETGGLTARAKVIAISMILVSSGLSMHLVPMPPIAVLSVALLGGCAAVYLATRPTVAHLPN
jgi:uncharacterized membrane protein YbaN (DUF454 family)